MNLTATTSCLLFLSTIATAQVFDLADACRGGDGTLPGTGPNDQFAINRSRAFLPQAGLKFVDGVFVPMDQGTTQIDSTGTKYDFSASIGGTGTNGTPANGVGLGTLKINDPSNRSGQPDYTGDPSNHSIMACHASVGITFDLTEIRKVVPTFIRFNAMVGGSCGGMINWFVLLDGKLAASGGGLNQNRFQAVDVLVLPTVKYLTLAIGDNNSGTINCAHGYWGDPFLHCGLSTFGRAGKDSTSTTVAVRAEGCPVLGSTLQVGADIGAANRSAIAMWIGISKTTWQGLQLPFDLRIIGAPDNFLNSSREVELPRITHTGGGGRTSLPIPNNPILKGLTVFLQGFVLDPTANSLGIVSTNSLVISPR